MQASSTTKSVYLDEQILTHMYATIKIEKVYFQHQPDVQYLKSVSKAIKWHFIEAFEYSKNRESFNKALKSKLRNSSLNTTLFWFKNVESFILQPVSSIDKYHTLQSRIYVSKFKISRQLTICIRIIPHIEPTLKNLIIQKFKLFDFPSKIILIYSI